MVAPHSGLGKSADSNVNQNIWQVAPLSKWRPQRNATQRNATQRNATQRNATQRNATPTQRNATQRNATQRNATQRNATQRNATQRNATQRNATRLSVSDIAVMHLVTEFSYIYGEIFFTTLYILVCVTKLYGIMTNVILLVNSDIISVTWLQYFLPASVEIA